MTRLELKEIENRIDEIDRVLDECGEGDDDVRDNLGRELDSLIGRLADDVKTNVIMVNFKERRRVA